MCSSDLPGPAAPGPGSGRGPVRMMTATGLITATGLMTATGLLAAAGRRE